MIDQAYVEGFVEKCAAKGVDPEKLLDKEALAWASVMRRGAKTLFPGKAKAVDEGARKIYRQQRPGLMASAEKQVKLKRLKDALKAALGVGAVGGGTYGAVKGVQAIKEGSITKRAVLPKWTLGTGSVGVPANMRKLMLTGIPKTPGTLTGMPKTPSPHLTSLYPEYAKAYGISG